jgi:hypothetical protein
MNKPTSTEIKIRHVARNHKGPVTTCAECKRAFWQAYTKEQQAAKKAAK